MFYKKNYIQTFFISSYDMIKKIIKKIKTIIFVT